MKGVLFLLIFFFSFGSIAGEGEYSLSGSHGIVVPSFNSAVFTNPAGLAYNQFSKFSGYLGSPERDLSRPEFGGALITGNAMVSGQIGILQSTFEDFQSRLVYGAGAYAAPLRCAGGVSGSTRLTGDGATSLNAGLLLFPNGDLRFGAASYGLNEGNPYLGAGAAFQIQNTVTFILDALMRRFPDRAYFIRPGVIWGYHPIYATASYNWRRGDSDSLNPATLEGPSFGLGTHFDKRLSAQIYFKQLNYLYSVLALEI